jgi:2-dehydropantoate 2-reductase
MGCSGLAILNLETETGHRHLSTPRRGIVPAKMASRSPSIPAHAGLSIAIIGLGSIGGVAAGCLALTGRYDVVACVRKPVDKLTFEWPQGRVDLPFQTLTDPGLIEKPVDWVLLCTKAYQIQSAAPWLKRLCAPPTRVAVLQNGVGHSERVAPLVGGAAVLPVIVYFNGERLAPDSVRLRQGVAPDVAVPDDAVGSAFAQLFADTPLRVGLSADFATLAWRKLFINAVANPITALTLQRQAVLRRPDVQVLCRQILDEAVAAARADGVRLSDDEPERAMALLFTFSGELGTSMYFDRLAGRPLEVEALTGAIVAAGKRHGIATPLNGALLTMLRAISDAATRI